MSANTKIEWADHTFNPWIGCTQVSPGCDHCYAKAWDRRFAVSGNSMRWGAGVKRMRTSAANWRQPLKWNAEAERLAIRYRVFCASLADVFDNEVEREWRDDLATLIMDTPNLDWLLLTKRIGNAGAMLGEMFLDGPPDNVWIGATICNQEEAGRDIPKLLAVPAAKRFLSMEPLLGTVDLTRIKHPHGIAPSDTFDCTAPWGTREQIDWVIVGGESGHGARPMQLQWVRSLVQQCRAAGVPVLVKQLGREVLDDGMSSPGEHWPPTIIRRQMPRVHESDPGFMVRLQHTKGGDSDEWPEDLRIREFP